MKLKNSLENRDLQKRKERRRTEVKKSRIAASFSRFHKKMKIAIELNKKKKQK